MDKKIIRKRMLCWGLGEKHSSGGPGQRTKIYQKGKAYYWVGNGPGYFILQEV